MTNNINFSDSQNSSLLNSSAENSYLGLSESYSCYLQQNGKSKQEVKNARTAINSWRNSLKINRNALVGKEFGAKFDVFVKQYIDEQANRFEKSTYTSRVSHIKAFRNFYLQQKKVLVLPPGFSKRLSFLLDINHYSAKKFFDSFLRPFICYSTLLKWISETNLPSERNVFVIEKIEHHLRILPGTLTSTLKLYPKSPKSLGLTPYGQKMSIARQKLYRMWTEILDDEFQGLLEFKTAVVPPLGMKRNQRSMWTGSDEDAIPPTASIAKGYLLSFFGFCCLPVDAVDPMLRGIGLNKKDLSLALLADAKILEEYITVFQIGRAGGKFNNGALTFICFLTSLLRKETGYLYQKYEFASKIGLPDDKSAWRKRCVNTRRRLLEIEQYIQQERSAGGDKFSLGRDPQVPISPILDLQHPLHVIMQMLNDMWADVAKLNNARIRQAILYRDALLIAMLQANPLRVRMLSIMKFDQHLFKKGDGSWWLKFKRNEFKNRFSLQSDYQIRLVPDIWHLIDTYLANFRPIFSRAAHTSYVFLSHHKKTRVLQGGYKFSSTSISSTIYKRTREYIPDSNGFGPHAFRHIVATDIIKNNPGTGFFLASKALHDKLATVDANYAHLKTNEFFEPYNTHLSETWKNFNPFDLKSQEFTFINNVRELNAGWEESNA